MSMTPAPFDRLAHPGLVVLIGVGVVLLGVGALAELVGLSMAAGFLLIYAVTMFLFAAVGYVSIYVVKQASRMFLSRDRGDGRGRTRS